MGLQTLGQSPVPSRYPRCPLTPGWTMHDNGVSSLPRRLMMPVVSWRSPTFLVAIMADTTSETWCQLASVTPGHRAVLYRTEIHAALAEISNMCRLLDSGDWSLLGARTCPGTCLEIGVVR